MNKKNMPMFGLGLVVLLVVLFGGYYLLNNNSYNMMKDNSTKTQSSSSETKLDTMAKDENPTGAMMGEAVMMSKSGDYQTADNGMTLYTFDKDTKNVSNCTGQCLVNWPPYLVTGDQSSTMPEHLGTFTKSDGSKQYTWDGLPLYFYIGDKNPGDTTGDGVGGIWHLVK